MSYVNKGDSLNSLKVLPGWTIEDDGFGLLTSRIIYVTNHGSDEGSSPLVLNDAPKRGDAHPKDYRLTCHRASSTIGANGLAQISAEYIGIATGNMTNPEVSGRGNMSTDPITTHPEFETKIGGTSASPLNGAKFQDATGLFIGFDGAGKTPNGNKMGVRSFLNPGFGINGHFYTSDIKVAARLRDRLGKTSGNGSFGGINLMGGLSGLGKNTQSIWGTWSSETELDQLLLTGLAVDFFGTVIKLSYDMTYAPYGWDRDIYDNGET
jgi:hypothetical protein